MLEVLKLLIAAILAVPAFVIGQAFLKFVLEPIQDQRRLKGKIIHALNFYASIGAPQRELPAYGGRQFVETRHDIGVAEYSRRTEAQEAIRDLASEVSQSRFVIPWYRIIARWCPRLVIPEVTLEHVADELESWSNAIYSGSTAPDCHRFEIARFLDVSLYPFSRAAALRAGAQPPQTQTPP